MARKVNFNVTCRYGVTYNVELHGSEGSKNRILDMLNKCCCFVCHNHNCAEPKDEEIPECNKVCSIYTQNPYCKRSKNE